MKVEVKGQWALRSSAAHHRLKRPWARALLINDVVSLLGALWPRLACEMGILEQLL